MQHRVVLVGVDDAMQSALRSALQARSAEPASSCADVQSGRAFALHHPGESHLFIVQLAPGEDPSRLTTITGSLPGQPVVALLPAGSDLSRLVAAQRAGAAQVVPLPFQADDFHRALDCVTTQFAPPPQDGRVLAICGVTGGCGATTLALNLACELAGPESSAVGRSPRRSVLLVELARQMGSLATYLDIEPPLTTLDLTADPSRLSTAGVRQALTTVVPGLEVLVGPYQDLNSAPVSSRHVYQLIELCRRLAAVVVLDVPCAFDDLQFETLALSDQVVLVGVQSIPSVRTLKMVRDTLLREEGIQGQQLVINRYDPGTPGFSAERLAELLGVPRVFTVANDYPSVMAALNYGKPLRAAAPHSRVLADVRTLVAAVSGAAQAPEPAPGDRLARALGGRAVPGPPPARRVRVLHIEDDVVQQHAMALHLATIKGLSCSVTAVTNEAEAVALFQQGSFDVVLLDYHLAQGNGLGCLRQLRKLDAIVPIVVVYGLAEPQIAAELLEAGADDFVSKENVSSERLARSLSAAVERADACKQRLVGHPEAAEKTVPGGPLTAPDSSRVALLGEIHKALGRGPDSELLRSLHELNRTSWPMGLRAGQIQRLVDLVCGELGITGESPRRALLTLFLRLFGGRE